LRSAKAEFISPLERLVRREFEFGADGGVLRLAGGPEAVHGKLDFAALVGTTLRLVPLAELQI
jgi:hypothetical protein